MLRDMGNPSSRKLQIVAGRFRDLGILYPSEQTCAHVIAVLAEAMMLGRPEMATPSAAAVISLINDFKSLMRAVRRTVPSGNVPRVYPEDPNELARTHPELFQKAFPDADAGPVFPSPVDPLRVELLRRGLPCRISHSSFTVVSRRQGARRAPSGLQASLLGQASDGEVPGLTIFDRPRASSAPPARERRPADGLLALTDGPANVAAAGVPAPAQMVSASLPVAASEATGPAGPLAAPGGAAAVQDATGVAAHAPADAASNAGRLGRLRAAARASSAPSGTPPPKDKKTASKGGQARSGTKKAPMKRPAAAKAEAPPEKKAKLTPPAQKGKGAAPPAQKGKGAAARAATSFPGVPKRKTEPTWLGDYKVYSDITKQAWRVRKPDSGSRTDTAFSWKVDPRQAWTNLVNFTTE